MEEHQQKQVASVITKSLNISRTPKATGWINDEPVCKLFELSYLKWILDRFLV
ncbi:hypothetical protein RYX36_006896, partial [Vicia faba]